MQIKHDPVNNFVSNLSVMNAEYLLRMQFLEHATEIVEDRGLQRFYAGEMKNIAKRQVLRM